MIIHQPVSDPGLDQSPILIGCCPSSGSTLLSVMLDAHPEVVCGPELTLFAHPFMWSETGTSWRERVLCYLDETLNPQVAPEWTLNRGVCPWVGFIDAINLPWYGLDLDFLRRMAGSSSSGLEFQRQLAGRVLPRTGKRVWAEKSPPNLYAIPALLESCPQAKAVIPVRDGRDVICSLLKRGYCFMDALAIWVLESALSHSLASHPRVHTLRYEDLIREPRSTLERLCGFLEIAPDVDSMLAYRQHSSRVASDPSISVATWKATPRQSLKTDSIGRWPAELSADQLYLFRAAMVTRPVAGGESSIGTCAEDLLRGWGYEPTPVKSCDWIGLARCLAENRSGPSLTGRGLFHHQHVELQLPVDCAGPDISEFLAALQQFSEISSRIAPHLAAPEEGRLAQELTWSQENLADRGSRLDSARVEIDQLSGQLEKMSVQHERAGFGLQVWTTMLGQQAQQLQLRIDRLEYAVTQSQAAIEHLLLAVDQLNAISAQIATGGPFARLCRRIYRAFAGAGRPSDPSAVDQGPHFVLRRHATGKTAAHFAAPQASDRT